MKIGRILSLCILLAGMLALFGGAPVLAQEEETIDLEPTYRKLEDTAPGASFDCDVALKFSGSETREFDLSASGPEGWAVSVKPSFGDQVIGSIRVEPFKQFPDKVKVSVIPPFFTTPEPGEYEVTLEVTSGNLRGSIELVAVITATYSLDVIPTNERYNTSATVGKDNVYSIVIQNGGSGTIENIKFSSRKPDGWAVEFTPEKVDTLAAGAFQTIDVNIKPDPKAIAGDYQITLAVDAKQTRESIDVRVTVETPTVWGWVGVGIILVIVAGVIAIFMRFSRR